MGYNIEHIREDFPILEKLVYGKQLVYLDNAATTQKPRQVIDRITDYYENENCNIHRGVHFLSHQATEAYEDTRQHVQSFINAAHAHEVVFTKGTTDAINLVASSFGRHRVKPGDEILVTEMEHHSNFVPWQMLAEEKKANFRVVPITGDGEIDMAALERAINKKTRLLAITHVSNSLGTVNPIKDIIAMAHRMDVPVIVDGAQAVPHTRVDVQELDCDFYCFSGHKVYGPMGVGVLYGKEQWLEAMPPYQGGGEMVNQVSADKTTFNELPFKFEAGTPNVAAVLGLDAAINYLGRLGMENIASYEEDLLDYATEALLKIDGIRLYGQAQHKTSVLSFNIKDIHPYDAGTIIDKFGIAVRTGHHCAQPVMDHYHIAGTIRASFALYNKRDEADRLVDAIHQVVKMF